MQKLTQTVRYLFILLLFVIFVKYFGYKSMMRYLEKNVIEEITVDTSPMKLPPPALTLCGIQNNTSWKNDSTERIVGNFETHCNNSVTATDLKNCVENKTFSLKDTVIDASLGMPGYENSISLMNASLWTQKLTLAQFGICYTLRGFQNIRTNPYSEGVYIILNPKLHMVYVMIHSPDFFMLTFNPSTLPMIQEMIDLGKHP